ncbi:hypothetical protein RVR_P226 (plasmid) [Actinacidiphila reveromycinica]|uniref:Uncharacterized protein n=1 Tax=Actinacidiphila reveromycinica TaxID=659352 RepID=A0A7R6T9Q3_9ACTN|nr:hypothetical protein [Streptomyces sp. SN-593]BBG20769.1 hypothetical protein RVR_P226 [Streptomyces sp. SN-593]
MHIITLARAATTAATCPDCDGAGGEPESSTDEGVYRETWRTCGTCQGRTTV